MYIRNLHDACQWTYVCHVYFRKCFHLITFNFSHVASVLITCMNLTTTWKTKKQTDRIINIRAKETLC